MAVPPNRFASLSQFWVPSLLFVLSVVSILFTLRNDEIQVIGPSKDRAVINSSDLEAHRQLINDALQGSASWRSWCENRPEAMESVRFDAYHRDPDASRWTAQRRVLPQREQDALLRCQNAEQGMPGPMRACFFLNSKEKNTGVNLHLVEVTLELREQGRKKIFSCAEALKTDLPVELAAWYTYTWTNEAGKKLLRFERLTGGTRIFPPLAQNAERSTASSRP